MGAQALLSPAVQNGMKDILFSGILNNLVDWATEHDNPQYILNLLKRIITISLDTMKIVNGLPALNERNQSL